VALDKITHIIIIIDSSERSIKPSTHETGLVLAVTSPHAHEVGGIALREARLGDTFPSCCFTLARRPRHSSLTYRNTAAETTQLKSE